MRYLPHTDDDRAAMLARIGVASIDDLFADMPADKRLDRSRSTCRRPRARSRSSASSARMAAKNVAAGSVPFFVGAGAYRHHVPASVDHLIQRSEFLTSYTPYQPEIAQGTLQYLFEFQTQVANLTGMEVANASMYDGSTATAEAVLMAHRLTKRRKAVLSGGLHPHYRARRRDHLAHGRRHGRRAAARSDAAPRRSSPPSTTTPPASSSSRRPSTATSSTSTPIAEKAHAVGALLVAVFTEVVALGAIEPPGAQGADIVVGEGQSIGNRAHLRRALCRPVRHAPEVRPPDAGPPLRRDGRCRRPARLRADAVDPRAAHPPRQGDLEHLHQLRPLLRSPSPST